MISMNYPQLLRSYFKDKDSFRVRLARGLAWSLGGSLLSQGLKLVASIVTARLVGQIRYGEFGVITSTIILFSTFAGVSFGMTATKYTAELYKHHREQTGRLIGTLLKLSIVSGLIITPVFFLMAKTIAEKLLHAEHLINDLQISSVFFVFSIANSVQLGVLIGIESFRAVAFINAVEGLLQLVFIILGFAVFDFSGIMIGYIASIAITWLLSQLILGFECKNSNINISYQSTTEEWTKILRFTLPAFLVSISAQPFFWMARVFLVNQPNGYREVAVLNAALAVGSVILFLPRQVSRPTMPILAGLLRDSNVDLYFKTIKLTLVLTASSACLVALPIVVMAKPIMYTYGKSFESGWLTLIFVVCGYTVGAITLNFRDVIASSGAMWSQVYHSGLWGGALLILSIMLIDLGATGIGIAQFVAYVILLVVQFMYLFARKVFKPQDCERAPLSCN
jgi:O-antigen/teichoic acid export membrane protein